MDAKELFSVYVSRAGGRAKAAKALGISAGMVGHIATGRRNVSIDVAKKIEAESNGFITRHDLRPDVFGPTPKQEAA